MRNIGTEGVHNYVVSKTDTRPVNIVAPVNVLGTDTQVIIDTSRGKWGAYFTWTIC